ncbi:histone-lysine N-methyltransferase SETMAR-like [Hydra vulgaris]|uniref:Histone-lysine N-methyltransferase SETMAR-like n=1 Tax=Hydra vulgaris TaxID=6087 RepID=A0ABM4C9U8_HYDVU
MDSVYGDSAPSFTTVKFWAAEFKCDCQSLGDDEHSGCPKTATTDENIAKVHQLVLDNRRIKVREIAEVMNISKERVCHILHENLSMRKLSARWVPRLLTLDQKCSKQWVANGEQASKKAKTVFSAGKVMATVFWDCCRVILIDYLQKGKTITGAYYASLLDKLKEQLAEKWPHLQKKKILFHQDNAPSHTSSVAMAKIHELRFELLDHPP